MIPSLYSRDAAKYLLVMLCHAPAGIAARCILEIAFNTNWRCNARNKLVTLLPIYINQIKILSKKAGSFWLVTRF